MADAIQVGRGKATVTITGPLARQLDTELRQVLGPLGTELQKRADSILANVRREWPVRTGKSANSWDTSLQIEPGAFKVLAALFSGVRYVTLIRSSKVGKEENATRLTYPLERLVRKPVRDARRELGKEAASILARHLQEVVGG